MMKTVLILWGITAVVAVLFAEGYFMRGDTIRSQATEISALKKDKSNYEAYIKNAKDKNLEDSELIQKLREQAKKPVSVCDCYNSSADSNVLVVLHKHGQK